MVSNLRAKLIGIIFGFLEVEVNGEVVLVHVAVWSVRQCFPRHASVWLSSSVLRQVCWFCTVFELVL